MNNTGPLFIAGKSGRLAQALIAEATEQNRHVVAMGRPDLDLVDRAAITRALANVKPRAIINASGIVNMEQAERDPDLAFAVNCDAAGNLAAAAEASAIPFVHLSSNYVFDGSKDTPYLEEDATTPISVYGKSKVAGESTVMVADPDAVIVRTSWLFGPSAGNFVTTTLRLAETNDTLRVVTDQHGRPTALTDLSRALLHITDHRLQGRGEAGIYHVAGRGETTWFELAQALFSGWTARGGRVPHVQAITSAQWGGPARPLYGVLDCTKAERIFGVSLPAWQESLERCLDRIAQNRSALAGEARAQAPITRSRS